MHGNNYVYVLGKLMQSTKAETSQFTDTESDRLMIGNLLLIITRQIKTVSSLLFLTVS